MPNNMSETEVTSKLAPNAVDQVDRLGRLAVLAEQILGRLDAGEPASAVLPAARRLARLAGREEDAWWFEAHLLGADDFVHTYPAPHPPVRQVALRRFLRERQQDDLREFSLEIAKQRAMGTFTPQKTVAGAPLAQLERIGPSVRPADMTSKSAVEGFMHAEALLIECRRVVDRVRVAIYAGVVAIAEASEEALELIALLGPDSPVVFASGGEMLAELRHAVHSLGQPGLASTAALQARTALHTMGRTLYPANVEHFSPISGKASQTGTEKNKLHAYLDDLWERSDAATRERLELQHLSVHRANELGSKGKAPGAITQADATEAVVLTYQVAHAICFGGGFPTRPGIG